MRKPTAKQLRLQGEHQAALEAATDAGRGWFEDHSEALAAEACREGSVLYGQRGTDLVLAFLEGFQQARRRHDDWLKEQAQ